jgi:hypothetical protein
MTLPGRKRLGDRRGRPRFEFVGQLWGSLETIEPLRLRNLGRGGALLEARFALQVDTTHRLRIASADQTSDLQARVRHVSLEPEAGRPRYLIGLEFLTLPPAAVAHLERLIAANVDPVPVAEITRADG